MYEDEASEGTGSESETGYSGRSNKRKRVIKSRDNDKIRVTWVEAAEIVLSQFNHPLPHKEILRLIEESDLKTTGRGNSAAPLAVLNSMLNSNSKGPSPLFYRSPNGGPCYGLTKNRPKSLSATPNVVKNEIPAKTCTEFKKEKLNKKLNGPTSSSVTRNLKLPGQTFPPSSLRVKKPLIPPGASKSVDVSRRCTPPLGTLSKAAYYERLKQQPPQQRRMGPTTSGLVRPAPPFSRPPAGAALRVPPGAALRVMPPKKRVKIDQDENDSDSSSQSKNDDLKNNVRGEPKIIPKVLDNAKKESLRVQVRTSKAITALKTAVQNNNNNNNHGANRLKNNNRTLSRPTRGVQQQRSAPASRLQSNKSFSPMKKTQSPQPLSSITSKRSSTGSTQQENKNTTNDNKEPENNKQTFFVGVKFKKLKKGNQDPLKRGGKESKLDFMAPDSVLNSLHFKDLFNVSTFNLLPSAYQYQLLMLLPEFDRVQGKDGSLRMSPHSLNNGFFTRACQEYKDKLLDGDLNSDILQRAKQEVNLYAKLDPWKVKYFESVYGQSSIDKDSEGDNEKPPANIQPVDSSWVAFLKFSENSTGDFEEALAKIQAEVKKIAVREAKEKEEEERRKKEALALIASLSFPSSVKLTKTQMRPLSGSPSRSNLIDKEKSKKALKKAQLLRRKKAIDKQLKDSRARIVEGACPTVTLDNKTTQLPTNILRASETNNKTLTENSNKNKILPLPSQISENAVKSENQIISTTTTKATAPTTVETTVPQKETENSSNTNILHLTNNVAIKKLFQQQQQFTDLKATKKSYSNNAKRRQSSESKPISRVVQGAATFGTNSKGVCPCNVKAMYLCKQCGSAWHGDCINNDKICILCS